MTPPRKRVPSSLIRIFSLALGTLGTFGTLCLTLLLTGCGDRESLVVYVSADEAFARPILKAFEDETGIRVDPVFDTEATKTTGLAQRLRAEKNRPRADVFWSSEIALTIQLADEGVLAPSSTHADLAAWPAHHRDPDGRWYAFAARARVIAYASDRIAEGDAPAAWTELAQDRWKGRVAMADPRFGTTRAHLGAMATVWDRHVMPGYFDAWLLGLAENRIALLTSGNAGVVQAIAEGQFDVGMTDSDDVWAAQARGLRISCTFPRHLPQGDARGGTLLIPNTCALVAGSAHPERAAQLLAYLLSPASEKALAASDSRNIPLGPTFVQDVAAKESPYAMPADPLAVDWARAAARTEAAVLKAMERLHDAASAPEAAPSPRSPDRDDTPAADDEGETGDQDRGAAPPP